MRVSLSVTTLTHTSWISRVFPSHLCRFQWTMVSVPVYSWPTQRDLSGSLLCRRFMNESCYCICHKLSHISPACFSLILCALCHCATPWLLLVENKKQDNNGDDGGSHCVYHLEENKTDQSDVNQTLAFEKNCLKRLAWLIQIEWLPTQLIVKTISCHRLIYLIKICSTAQFHL